ncbi:hypothetical protein [Nocardia sp. NPDC049149]|uniref:hypothetical protein n=1 Tax=Nocardia sp. NPDC049149 TaxID=3364315 RepID=UPI003714A5DD
MRVQRRLSVVLMGSLGMLYGTVTRHTEQRLVSRHDESATATVWIDDAAPVERTYTADQLRNAAASAKEAGLSCGPGILFFAGIDVVALLSFAAMFTPAILIEFWLLPVLIPLWVAAILSPFSAVGWCIFGWFQVGPTGINKHHNRFAGVRSREAGVSEQWRSRCPVRRNDASASSALPQWPSW